MSHVLCIWTPLCVADTYIPLVVYSLYLSTAGLLSYVPRRMTYVVDAYCYPEVREDLDADAVLHRS